MNSNRRKTAKFLADRTTRNPCVYRLKNETIIAAQEVPGEDVGISIAIPYGLADDIYLPHFIEHLIFRSRTTNLLTNADSLIERLGGYYTGETCLDAIILTAKVRRENLQRALEIIHRSIANPNLEEQAMRIEKRVVIGELLDRKSEANHLTDEAMYRHLFQGHPLECRTETVEGIKSIRKKQLEDAIKKYFGGRSFHIGIAGENQAKLVRLTTQIFSTTPKGGIKPRVYSRPNGGEKINFRTYGNSEGVVSIGFIVPGYGNEDRYAMDVLVNILSGGIPEYETRNRLWKTLRDKRGFMYHTFVDHELYPGIGLLNIKVGGIMKHNIYKVRDLVIAEIERLTRRTTPLLEFTAARNSLLLSQYRDNQGYVEDISYNLAASVMAGEDLGYREYERRIMQLEPRDIKEVAQKYIKNQRMFIGIQNPK
jgi:predicted Zn-dependent peptidase